MPSTASMAREDILCVVAGGVVHEDVERALLPDAVHHRFDRVRQAHVAPYGLDLSTGLLGQFLGRLLQHVLAAATDHNVRAELEEAVCHRAAESRAATSHQNALALQEVGLKHRVLNSWLKWAALRDDITRP